MQFPCELKTIGGSHYIVVNPLILGRLKAKKGDIIIVDFIKKEV